MGRGSAATIRGPIASGKTELLALLGEEAVNAGATVLSAFARCSETDIEFGVIGQIFRHPEFTPAEHEKIKQSLGKGGRGRPCEADGLPLGGLPTRVCQELWELLRAKTKHVPLVVAVDDVHFADAASLQALIEFSARIRNSRLLIAVAEADTFAESKTSESSVQPLLLRQPHFTRVQVRLLSRHATAQLLVDALSPELGTEPAAGSWHGLSGGTPLLLRALVEDYRRATWLGSEHQVEPIPGAEFSQAVEACVRRGGSRFQDVARAIAEIPPTVDNSQGKGRLVLEENEHRHWQ